MAKYEFGTPEEYQATKEFIQGALEELTKKLKHEPAQALYDALIPTLTKAVERAPVDEGILKSSAKLTVNGSLYAEGEWDGTNGTVNVVATAAPSSEVGNYDFEIGFWGAGRGGGNVDAYAWIQHEETAFNHPKGGDKKFLESAIREDQATWVKKMKDAVKEAIDDFQ